MTSRPGPHKFAIQSPTLPQADSLGAKHPPEAYLALAAAVKQAGRRQSGGSQSGPRRRELLHPVPRRTSRRRTRSSSSSSLRISPATPIGRRGSAVRTVTAATQLWLKSRPTRLRAIFASPSRPPNCWSSAAVATRQRGWNCQGSSQYGGCEGRARGYGTPLACSKCHGSPAHHISPVHDAKSPVYLEHQVKTCGDCHAEHLGTYLQSVHGQGLNKLGLINTAVCANCHGSHGIYRAGRTIHALPHPRRRHLRQVPSLY